MNNYLIERVCHLTNKIYRETLCISRDERMTFITIGGLDDIQAQVSTFSWTPQYRISLSWDLLAWISFGDIIPHSFTDFITTPELSGPLYISSNIYHTQITEYSLETLFLRHHSQWVLFLFIERLPNCYSVSSSPFYLYHCNISPDRAFKEHISHALPTEMIFYLLRSIPSKLLLLRRSLHYLEKSELETLEIIIKWLQVSVSECNWQTPQTKNLICVYQGLGSERPSDLYDRFQGELLHYRFLHPSLW